MTETDYKKKWEKAYLEKLDKVYSVANDIQNCEVWSCSLHDRAYDLVDCLKDLRLFATDFFPNRVPRLDEILMLAEEINENVQKVSLLLWKMKQGDYESSRADIDLLTKQYDNTVEILRVIEYCQEFELNPDPLAEKVTETLEEPLAQKNKGGRTPTSETEKKKRIRIHKKWLKAKAGGRSRTEFLEDYNQEHQTSIEMPYLDICRAEFSRYRRANLSS